MLSSTNLQQLQELRRWRGSLCTRNFRGWLPQGAVTKHVPACGDGQGWQDAHVVIAFVLLNLAGGEHVSDLELLRRDEGFVRVLRTVSCAFLPRKERLAKMRLMKKSGDVPPPGASSVFRSLQSFHRPEQQVEREAGKAVIVKEQERLQRF